MNDIQLSKNFWLSEFTHSQSAIRQCVNNAPCVSTVKNLKALCINLLQPLRDELGCPIIISSGYRSPQLNKIIGGANNSQHVRGQAVDFTVPNMTLVAVIEMIQKNFPFDQLILEFGSWIHVSYCSEYNRKQVLTINHHGTFSGIRK